MCRAPTNCWASVRGRHRIADSPYWRTSAGSPKAEQFGVWEMNAETPWQRKFRRRGVLTDHELDALRGIERRLRWESPELIRLFNSVEPQPAKPHCKRARTRMLAATAVFAALTLLGPRMLNDEEVSAQQRRPLPRTAPPD